MPEAPLSPFEEIRRLLRAAADPRLDLDRLEAALQRAEAASRRPADDLQARLDYQRALLDQALDAVLLVEADGRISDVNRRAADLLGYPGDQLLGLNFKQLIPVEEWTSFAYQRDRGQLTAREQRMLQKNASPVLVELSARPQPDGRLLVSARDVTERRQLEATREQNESRLAAIVASIDEVAFEYDGDGTYINIWTNDESLLLLPRAQLLGRTLEEVFDHPEARRLLETIRRVLYNRQPESLEYALTLNGQHRWFLARVAPIPAVNSFVKTVLMLARDITERKRAEALLAQNSAEIAALYRASAQLLAPARDVVRLAQHITEAVTREFDFVGCSVLLVDEAGVELRRVASAGGFVVAAAQALPLNGLGLTVAAFQTRKPVYVPEVAHDPRYFRADPRTRSELAVPLVAGQRALGVLDLQSPEPDAFPERARQIVEVFADNAALALENAHLVTHLESARQAAEEANQLKSMFLANTSHELRTPLAVIMGSLDAILNGLVETPVDQGQLLRTAHGASERLLRLITDLLDFAQIEAGRMNLQMETVDLLPMLAEIYMFMRPRADRKHLRFELHLPAQPPPPVWADTGRVEQILINLLDNAVKFTEAGRVVLDLETDPQSPDFLRIVIADTGIGIAPEKQALLFQPFVQADGSMTRRYGGTGLGLSIARRLVELMGGTLALHSAGAGQGCTFTVRLPLAQAVAQP